MNENPFDIIKANLCSDEELEKFWVDFNFEQLIQPKSAFPMLILGSKGSGKTHVMKHFSYDLQKIRHKDDLKNKIIEDGYIGIFWRAGGLNGSRFINKGLNQDSWLDIFRYYTELWIAQLLLATIKDLSERINEQIINKEIISEIINLFDEVPTSTIETQEELSNYLRSLQRTVDITVNNLSLKPNTDLSSKIKISLTSGSLIFGIPKILSNKVCIFKNTLFIYLIDEYENIEEYQQQYFNTLLRESEAPTTFKIGGRPYGIKTYKTFSGGEGIKEGNEYSLVDIDNHLRLGDKEKYKNFLSDICIKRLVSTGHKGANIKIEEHFEEFEEGELLEYNREKFEHLKDLKKKLESKKIPKNNIEEIIKNTSFPNDLIIERTNVLLLYRHINSGKYSIIEAAKKINESASKYYLNKSKDTPHSKVLEKFKRDIIDQLHREIQKPLPYYGFDDFAIISSGNPRVFLRILKEIYQQAIFRGESPFNNEKISKVSQALGLEKAIAANMREFEVRTNVKANLILRQIGIWLQNLRFSDTPPECSICTFIVSLSDLNEEQIKILELLEHYSCLISSSERRGKNGPQREKTYQISPSIALNWELAIAKRSIVAFNKTIIDGVFNESEQRFNEFINIQRRKYTFPFKSINQTSTLFDE